MDPGYYVAAGSLNARSVQLEVLANNLANVQTVGYKKEQTFFSTFNKAAASLRKLPLTKDVNDGTVLAQRGVDMSQGATQSTGRAFDLAIEGNGFFVIQTPQGNRLTRDGRLKLGKDGQLQALDGSPVLGKNGQFITLDPSLPRMLVAADGTISQGTDQQNQKVVGQLGLKNYANPSSMTRVGNLRFDPGTQAEVAATGTLAQGYLEQSGVDVAACMVEMIRINRLFEMSLKVASTLTNDFDSRATNDLAGLR
jgi:flagellar basal-body rod protein FlgF